MSQRTPEPFMKLDAMAVLTGPLLPAPWIADGCLAYALTQLSLQASAIRPCAARSARTRSTKASSG